ncbi:MAG: hypothetical protein LUQ50_09335 [Methanospirillum sp.]|uniref:hypothetical protein n=1 Tax=Methanospirillum sp. TaxID=45200 RepID=UPI002373E296|nr:hypothetical protein [Methanospirillum sp.]MDD1729261.1 hypothetical protein [Methanospirillum sp.]
MIRRFTLFITSILFLSITVIAADIGSVNNSTTSDSLNLTNATANTTQQALPNTTSQEITETSPTPTTKPVYKQSIGSVYEADYTEPEPMTFTSYPTC